ncbi:MAG TPA: enoyl-CoA hydratase/isomerase family protein [Acidimicrobiales bacterium]|nr:enoyl-CoA hydratase/isomerase family protein [Acidimicrobiales bacterium]
MPGVPGAPDPETLTATEFSALFGGRLLPGELDLASGLPLVVVDLDDAPEPNEPLPAPSGLVVGVTTGAPFDRPWAGADILLAGVPDPPRPWAGSASRWLPRIEAAVAANPLAALAAAQLLRLTETLPTSTGLLAESFAYSMLQAGPEHRDWLARHAAVPPPPEAGPAVLVARDGPRLSVILNRPDRHNAYGTAMRDGLVEAISVAVSDPTVEEIDLSGAGPSFCSGGDLGEFGTAPDPATAHAVRVVAGAAPWLDRCAQRLVARVHGACLGAGVELASFAGRVVATADARFGLPEVGMGLVPGAGGTVSVPRRIGRQRAALLAVTGVTVDAATALGWGLVDQLLSA